MPFCVIAAMIVRSPALALDGMNGIEPRFPVGCADQLAAVLAAFEERDLHPGPRHDHVVQDACVAAPVTVAEIRGRGMTWAVRASSTGGEPGSGVIVQLPVLLPASSISVTSVPGCRRTSSVPLSWLAAVSIVLPPGPWSVTLGGPPLPCSATTVVWLPRRMDV